VDVIVDFDFLIADLGEPRHISKEDDIKRLEQAIAAKANARQDITQLVQDGLLTYGETKARLQAVAREEAELRGRLAEVESEVELNAMYRQRWEAFKAKRSQYGLQLYDIEQDPERKRAVIAELIAPIEVETTGEGRRKRVAVTYQLFDDEEIRGIPLDNL
jgi:chromosome segregation ATPase